MASNDMDPRKGDDAFSDTLKRHKLPDADAGLDADKKKKLAILAVAGVLALTLLFFWVTRKPSPKALPEKETVSKTDKVIKDAQEYRLNENDPSKSTSLDPNFFASNSNPGKSSRLNTGADFPSGGLDQLPEAPAPMSEAEKRDSRVEAMLREANETRQQAERERSSGGRAQAAPSRVSSEPLDYEPPYALRMRLSKTYTQALAFLDSRQVIEGGNENRLAQVSNPTAVLDSQYMTLAGGPRRGAPGIGKHIPAGTELRGYTNEVLNTDYPSVIKGTLTHPPELKGATALISYRLAEERASATVEKIIMPPRSALDKPSELTIASVVKDGLPGLGGDVNHHWGPQIAAGIINGGMTGAALYYAANYGGGDDLGTAVLMQPAIEKGLEGALKPVNYLGRARNITVTVDAGKEFTVLVTTGFDVP